MKMIKEKKYGLFTALAMIVGIVIGSGIFFKVDDILELTQGNIGLGVLVFVLAAIAIVFGSLAIAQLAKRTDKADGLIAYADEFIGPRAAGIIGRFQALLYYPTLTAIISRVVGIYVCILFAIPDVTLELQMGIGLVWMLVCFVYNIFAQHFAVRFQNYATVIKLIPLFVIAIAAFVYGSPIESITNPRSLGMSVSSFGRLAAVGPIAFAFDGWIVSTSIGHKLKNAKRNLPLALTIAPLVILVIYLLYFVGVSGYLGAEAVLEYGDASIDMVAKGIFGSTVAKAVMVFVVVSIMGTFNGLIMGYVQLPYSLALRGLVPFQDKLSLISKKYGTPIYSALFALVMSLVRLVVHYFAMTKQILGKMDISEISIVVSYLLYIMFYYQVFRLRRKGKITSIFSGVIVPVLATIGSVFIFMGGKDNPSFFTICVPVCLVVIASAYLYNRKK